MKRSLALLVLLASPALAQPAPVLLASDAAPGTGDAYDLVFVSEGYRATEEAQFLADARAASKRVATEQAAAPLRAMKPFSFHYVFVPSNAAGAPHADGAAPADTAFKAHVDATGWLDTDDAAAETAATTAPDVDGVVILIKFATGAPFVRSNADVRPASSGRVRLARGSDDALIHELGHTIGGLGDEYTEHEGEPPEEQRKGVALFSNLSLDPTGARWKAIVPTAFEGGGRYKKGVWRGEEHCRMNECTSGEFCAVCKAAIAKPRTAPPAASTVAVTDGVASWKTGTDAPMAWWVQVERATGLYTYEIARKMWVEPHKVGLDVKDLPPGDYRIVVWAESMGASSAPASTKFKIPKPPTPTPGIIGAGIGH